MLLVGIESIGGFVEDQHRRIVQDRLREADPVTVSLGEGVDRLVCNVFEVADLHRAGDGIGLRLAGEAADGGGEVQKSGDAHILIGGGVFRQVAEEPLCADRIFFDIAIADGDPAAGEGQKAGDHPHGGGFPGTVGAEEAEHFPFFDREAHPVDGGDGAESLLHISRFYHAETISFLWGKMKRDTPGAGVGFIS